MCVGEALWRHSLGVEAFLGRAYLWQNWFPLFLSCSWHLHSKIQDQERGSREYGVGLIPEEERIFDFFFLKIILKQACVKPYGLALKIDYLII